MSSLGAGSGFGIGTLSLSLGTLLYSTVQHRCSCTGVFEFGKLLARKYKLEIL